jgi:molecular chaperone DnaK
VDSEPTSRDYALGVDLGTTFTAAAVFRDGHAEVVQLSQRSAAAPSVVFLKTDETMLTGDAAVRRGVAEPARVGREFKRRVGDPAPMLLGGVPLAPEHLMARLLRATIDAVAEREGGAPDVVVVCHPANWGPYKLELLDQVCRIAGVSEAVRISEPEAAAVHYSSLARLEPGSVVAVYDLGGGTFDAAILRKTEDGFSVLGEPEGIERLGGIDFDEAVLAHVREACAEAIAELDFDDPSTTALLARLRQDCVEAKEALSLDTETSIPVVLPGLRTEVRLTRGDLESMIRVPLIETVAALRRAMASAHVEPDDLTSVLLVGGSSRIPMVAELVTAELGRPVAVDSDPKHVVALGAARLGAMRRVAQPVPALVGAPGEASAADVPLHAPLLASPPPPPPPPSPVAARQPTPSPEAEASEAEPRGRRRWVLIAAGAVAAVAAAIVAVVVLVGGGGDDGDAAAGGAPPAGQITTCPAAGQPAVCITGVQRDGNSLNVAFTTHDVTLVSNPTRGDQLTATFFLSATDSTASSGVALRQWGASSPFRQQYSADELDGASAVCVLVGNGAGQIAPGTGNCAELPKG